MKYYSRQREKIEIVIKNMHNHPTAEEIYMRVKSFDPSVSRSTVYRNLNILISDGVVNKIPVPNGGDRFDYVHEGKIHSHVMCKKCGMIVDFLFNFDYDEIKKLIQEQSGIEILENSIIIEGFCEKCKKNI